MSTRRDQGEATRARILTATAELISEAGWSGFSTRDIAARAGVTQGVVSYHWRSKDDLVREAALAASAESLEPVARALREAPSVREALERSLALVEALRGEPALALLLFETMLHAGRDERLREALAEMLRDFRAALAAALEREGVSEAEPLAAALSAAWDGLFLHAVVDPDLPLAPVGDVVLKLLSAGSAHAGKTTDASSRRTREDAAP